MKSIRGIAAASLALGLAGAALAANPADTITLTTPFGQSQVLAWSWGASSSSSWQAGGGASVGKANFQDMSFTRYTDLQSPKFLEAIATGQAQPSVTITRGTLRFDLENVFVTSYSVGASAGDKSQQTENLSLNFRRIRYTIDGVAFCFDVPSNNKC
jgi:type VI protein secretion system component Hcp